jgi:dUTP pyrophosphatase
MQVKVKKLNERAVLPKKAHPTDAGFDLVATSKTIDKNGNIVYGTGLAFEIPEGYVGYIFPRSSISKQDIALSNCVGVIDCHYRGEVMFKFKPTMYCLSNNSAEDKLFPIVPIVIKGYKVGDRIGQLIIMPIPEIELEEADELSETDRGTGGYGSSGR